MKQAYISEWIDADIGRLPKISTKISWRDCWGNVLARCAIARDNYKITPGLYIVGNPTPDSPILVSANYKLSFDVLRKELKAIDAWILVLDTKGVNVWCAAGKGTFGTQELLYQIATTQLQRLVRHRELIVPQLGAPGISAHEVKRQSGFSIKYAPIRAVDLPCFLQQNGQVTAEMREIQFSLFDRLKLIPAEIVVTKKYLFIFMLIFFFLSGVNKNGYDIYFTLTVGVISVTNILLAYSAGVFWGPFLLPWLPGRRFALKGVWTGILLFFIAFLFGIIGKYWMEKAAWLLIYVSVSSFTLLNFTGSTTYTSLSGVKKEMKISVPLQMITFICGLIFWFIARGV